MAHRVKCPECLSCMSPVWPDGFTRLYYCGLCGIWYGGRDGELVVVPNPNQDKIDKAKGNKLEDPVLEDENEFDSEPQ